MRGCGFVLLGYDETVSKSPALEGFVMTHYLACDVPIDSVAHRTALINALRDPGAVKFKKYSGTSAKPSATTNFIGVFDFEVAGESFVGIVGKIKKGEYIAGAFYASSDEWVADTYEEEVLSYTASTGNLFRVSDYDFDELERRLVAGE